MFQGENISSRKVSNIRLFPEDEVVRYWTFTQEVRVLDLYKILTDIFMFYFSLVFSYSLFRFSTKSSLGKYHGLGLNTPFHNFNNMLEA